MRIKVFTSSPRDTSISVSSWMASHLASGMSEAGAEVEIIKLQDYNIKTCLGCFGCWSVTPGVCVLMDDMTNKLFEMFMNADLVILASPLYYFHLNATMVNFVNRLLPNNFPGTDRTKEYSAHPLRRDYPPIVLAVASFFEDSDVFTALSYWFHRAFGKSAIAIISRTASQSICHHQSYIDLSSSVIRALHNAGRELVNEKQVSSEILSDITREIPDYYIWDKETDLIWETCIGQKMPLQKFIQTGSLLFPQSLDSFITMMTLAYDTSTTERSTFSIQFIFPDHVEKQCWISVGGPALKGAVGVIESPDLTITAPYKIWINILHKVISPLSAISQGMIKINGNMSVFAKMGVFFKAGK